MFVLRPLVHDSKGRYLKGGAPFRVNLPGWRWGTITQLPLVAVSRPLHSGVCETRQDAGLPVLHSEISDRGRLRTRGGQRSRRDRRTVADGNLAIRNTTSAPGCKRRAREGSRFWAVRAPFITAASSLRVNLSPFTKDCRALAALM